MKVRIKNNYTFEQGCLVQKNDILYMLCFDTSTKSYKLLDLNSGEIKYYNFYDNINAFANDLGLTFICKNEDISLYAERGN